MRGTDERIHPKPEPSSASSKLTHERVGQLQRHIALNETRHLPLKATAGLLSLSWNRAGNPGLWAG